MRVLKVVVLSLIILFFVGLSISGMLISFGFIVLYLMYKVPKVKSSNCFDKNSTLDLRVVVDKKTRKYKTLVRPKREYS